MEVIQETPPDSAGYGKIICWIIENLNGEWTTTGPGYYFFKDADDAMAFKLTLM